LATVRAFAFCDPLVEDDGSEGDSAGNRPAALPPGLSVGLAPCRYGRLPTDSGVVVVTGVGVADVPAPAGAAVTFTVADASGLFGRCAALMIAVSLTDLTLDEVAEIATRA
jgi:hypothetical protein